MMFVIYIKTMKKTKEETARSRERILASAARRFREGGFEGVSVKDLMQEAGLTHGAFYAHFPSKEALMGAACKEAMAEAARRQQIAPGETREEALERFIRHYLRDAHVTQPGQGCVIPALGGEAARAGGEIQEAMAGSVAGMLERLTVLAGGRAEAITLMAELVGALLLARTVEPGPLRDEILATARAHLLP
jgi:TetR/AcrR family transcriptional repressor of nem operon